MFDSIAHRYDLLNTVLSLGSDGRWRRRAARAAEPPAGGRALDVACGSGKLTAELRRLSGGGLVIGVDFSAQMLQIAARHEPGSQYVRGDCLSLPFSDCVFDAVTVAFGLRNFADPERGLLEMRRVLKPGGRAVVLEFVRPRRGPLGAAYRSYLLHVLPRVGGWISGDRPAYRYLSATVDSYRTPDELVDLASGAGWRDPGIELLNLGTVGLLAGKR